MDKSRFSYQLLLQTLEEEHGAPLSARVKDTLQEVFDGHRGQFRESRVPEHRLPFIVHPVGTACLAIKYFPLVKNIPDELDTVICVALAHDLLEDTRVDGSRIEAAAGSKVRIYVEALTKPPAGVAGRSAEERNREFLDSIVEAGTTAAFVKICDNMHNLSRPAATPPNLLVKLVDKAKNQYLPLLERCSLGEEFKQIYCDLIVTAEDRIVKDKEYIQLGPSPSTLESAITECIAASTGKILELHDISAILDRICRAESITIWRYSGGGEGFLTQVTGPQQKDNHVRLRAVDFCEFPQILTGQAVRDFPVVLSGGEGCSSIFTVPMQIGPEAILVVALGFDSEGPPPWFSLDSATMLIQFLAHRLIVSEADRRERLASTAANLGMQLNVEIASRIGVQPAELVQLQRWRSRCRQAIAVIEHLVDFFLLSEDPNIPLHELVRVEYRVKTVDSIIRKYLPPTKRVWPEYEKLEDIAGIRVICPTLSGLHAIEQFLLSNRASASGVRLHPTINEPRRDYVNAPTKSGYRSIHLILEVKTHLGDEGTRMAPCEVQLRTMFQDTWATISHATLYRASNKEHRHYSGQLKEMGEALEHCEELAEKLVTKQ